MIYLLVSIEFGNFWPLYVCVGRVCGSLWKCVMTEKVKISDQLYACDGRVCGSLWKCVMKSEVDDSFACDLRNHALFTSYACVAEESVKVCGNVLLVSRRSKILPG